uniref:Uncharacterized protein n=1 Tax=Steinernema glaseri TaxID=37863 RepID=A0A1I7ZYA8_9BILA
MISCHNRLYNKKRTDLISALSKDRTINSRTTGSPCRSVLCSEFDDYRSLTPLDDDLYPSGKGNHVTTGRLCPTASPYLLCKSQPKSEITSNGGVADLWKVVRERVTLLSTTLMHLIRGSVAKVSENPRRGGSKAVSEDGKVTYPISESFVRMVI